MPTIEERLADIEARLTALEKKQPKAVDISKERADLAAALEKYRLEHD